MPKRPDPTGGPFAPGALPEPGSETRWPWLQQMARSSIELEPWLIGLADGEVAPEHDLLEVLVAKADRASAVRLLQIFRLLPWKPLLEAMQQLWIVPSAAVTAVWLDPLLHQWGIGVSSADRDAWVALIGQFQDPASAGLLRQALSFELQEGWLVQLGHQRQPDDVSFLLGVVLGPQPLVLRKAALEGLAVGLSAWPLAALLHGLAQLIGDINPEIAAKSVDLIARLPGGQQVLRGAKDCLLEPAVRQRLSRRLQSSPLVLVVHGRSGGLIPKELAAFAADLGQRRGAPVLVQALTGEQPLGDPAFWLLARQVGVLSFVPLLLLPGGHVRGDLPNLASPWRALCDAAGPVLFRRFPFLGAWPEWQVILANLAAGWRAQGADFVWLHHPLEGPLALRYLEHLTTVLGCPGCSTPFPSGQDPLNLVLAKDFSVLPYTLATNRLSESLQPHALPPLLCIPQLREQLMALLEALP